MPADDHLGSQFKKSRKPGITPTQIQTVWGSAYIHPWVTDADEGDDAGDSGDGGGAEGGGEGY